MNASMDWYHYALLAFVVVAAIVFAFFGKMDVSVAFGIAGTAVGLSVPTAPSKPTPPAP